jgi:hypothetical protein
MHQLPQESLAAIYVMQLKIQLLLPLYCLSDDPGSNCSSSLLCSPHAVAHSNSVKAQLPCIPSALLSPLA